MEVLQQSSEQKEQLLRTINNMRIVVHPSFYHNRPSGVIDVSLNVQKHTEDVTNQHKLLLQRSIPQGEDDITLIMPHAKVTLEGNWDRESWQEAKQSAQEHPEIPTWQRLYRSMKASTVYAQNIILTKDIILSNSEYSAGTIRDFLRNERGKIITPETVITLEGEAEDACVAVMGERLLRFPDISTIRIDKQTTISSYDESFTNQERLQALQNISSYSQFNVSESPEYFQVTKKA